MPRRQIQATDQVVLSVRELRELLDQQREEIVAELAALIEGRRPVRQPGRRKPLLVAPKELPGTRKERLAACAIFGLVPTKNR